LRQYSPAEPLLQQRRGCVARGNLLERGPVIVLPDSLFTNTRYIILDASGSFSPQGNNPLKFFWTSLDSKAAIANPASATPNVWLNTGSGPWVFEVIVTDSRGNSSTKQITVRLTQGP